MRLVNSGMLVFSLLGGPSAIANGDNYFQQQEEQPRVIQVVVTPEKLVEGAKCGRGAGCRWVRWHETKFTNVWQCMGDGMSSCQITR